MCGHYLSLPVLIVLSKMAESYVPELGVLLVPTFPRVATLKGTGNNNKTADIKND